VLDMMFQAGVFGRGAANSPAPGKTGMVDFMRGVAVPDFFDGEYAYLSSGGQHLVLFSWNCLTMLRCSSPGLSWADKVGEMHT
jgi:hypothetical protein